MLEEKHVLDLLSPEDLDLVKILDGKANHPDLKWSGYYFDGKFTVSVTGPVAKDGTRYEAASYIQKDTWGETYKSMIDSMCINYPELMYHFYPEYE